MNELDEVMEQDLKDGIRRVALKNKKIKDEEE